MSDPPDSPTSLPGWLPLLILPAVAFLLIPSHWPRWGFMWTLAVAIFLGCKWLTWYFRRVRAAPAWRHLAYLFLWPGLDPDAFLDAVHRPARPALQEWIAAAAKMLLGAALVFLVAPRVPADMPVLTGWTAMIGLILMLHFGSFHLLSCAWRSVRVDARPLMVQPLRSRGISEFWGRRWNTAFRDLTHRYLFRPLNAKMGPRAALFVGFLFSGIVHDLVISLPSGGGYGGPTLFFLLQAGAMLLERMPAARRAGLGKGWRGRLFTFAVLILPVPLLFHLPFVREIIIPFITTTLSHILPLSAGIG